MELFHDPKSSLNFVKFNDEVFYTEDSIVKVGPKELEFLKTRARQNPRRRMRLCAHKNTDDRLHEMLIVHAKTVYVRPHRHINKSESMSIIEGLVDVVLFSEKGDVTEVIPMGPMGSGDKFYYRMSGSHYHSLIIKSETLVFLETTSGPFNREETIFPPWAPEENEISKQVEFVRSVRSQVQRMNT